MRPTRGTLLAVLAPGLLLGGPSACQEPPSYRLRWSIEGRGAPTTSACSESGLFELRARAFVDAELFIDQRVLPCAVDRLADDPDALVDGSALPPGAYALQLRGFDREGQPWQAADGQTEPDPDVTGCTDDASACLPTEQVCSCTELIVTEGQTVDLPELVIAPPPECDDGIDNDQDGVVDARDPSCQVDGGAGGEGLPVGLTELRLDLTLLAGNPNATCSSVPLRSVQVALQTGAAEPTVLLEETCQLERPYLLSLRIPEGSYTFSVIGLDASGEPVTLAKAFDASINATGGSILESIDFAPEDFLDPIEARMSISPQYVGALGLDEGNAPAAPRGSCSAMSSIGTLDIAGLRMTLFDGHGGPLSSPVLLDGIPLDGTERECASLFLTDTVTWGGYVLQIDAVSADGEVCFSNAEEPEPMRPSETLGVYLPRAYDDAGQVPASCRECEADGDCDPDEPGWACLDGVCQRPCELDRDCESLVLGDLGFACLPVEGRDESYCVLE